MEGRKLGKNQDLVYTAVRWNAPGSRFSGLVHYVPAAVIHDVDADGKVVVWWPRRNGGKRWEGRGVASKFSGI